MDSMKNMLRTNCDGRYDKLVFAQSSMQNVQTCYAQSDVNNMKNMFCTICTECFAAKCTKCFVQYGQEFSPDINYDV